ncbi:acyltransferase family protein [Veronia pacifica]|uniref:Acyltransferase 3 domain-containing protein n=1 Tax=Veronia pacifica TaxID=1080227 RepID=A0A1C3EGA0_9GAMM|nr:acyltransferase family protein [Veronia pacifica]ODA32258.1 hypothetical protein A8L45_13785 [Veronia pacifica]
MTEETTDRRYDLDWLRVIAVFLLIVYHCAITFQPWAAKISFIQNSQSATHIWTLMSALNVWRIPLVFLISGFAFAASIRRRSPGEMIRDRASRILLPAIFTTLILTPVHYALFQVESGFPVSYRAEPAHVWFLYNIFIYAMLAVIPLNHVKHEITIPAIIILLVLPAMFVVEAAVIQPERYANFYLTTHGFVLGLAAFVFGIFLAYAAESVWQLLSRWFLVFLIIATGLYLARISSIVMVWPTVITAIEASCWIFAVLGVGNRYLNTPSGLLSLLGQSVYPVYLVHMIFMYAVNTQLITLALSPEIKFCLLVVMTVFLSFGAFLVLRPIPFVKTLFGMK